MARFSATAHFALCNCGSICVFVSAYAGIWCTWADECAPCSDTSPSYTFTKPAVTSALNTFFSSSNNFGFSAHVFVFAPDSNELLSMLRFLFGSSLYVVAYTLDAAPRENAICCHHNYRQRHCHRHLRALLGWPEYRLASSHLHTIMLAHPVHQTRMEVSGDFDDFCGNSDAVQRTRDYDDSYLCCL